jgi:RsiW-degrading membrane proteinase PrsW (M82 family)
LNNSDFSMSSNTRLQLCSIGGIVRLQSLFTVKLLTKIFSFICMFCRSLFVLFLLTIVLYVLLWYTDADYPLVSSNSSYTHDCNNFKAVSSFYYYVSPSNEGRHIVLVWFFLLPSLPLLLSEACPDHNFFVFPDMSMIYGTCMSVHDHKVVCRIP